MKTTYRLNACCCVMITCAWFFCCGYARAQLIDLSQFKNEHLITSSANGETGDVSIYVSFPNWFGQPGYCPVRVRVVPRKGLQFKKTGQLKVTIGQNIYASFDTKGVVVEIPIKKGTGVATSEVLGNFLIESTATRGYSLTISAKLDGKRLSGHSAQLYNGRSGTTGDEGCKSLVLISEESSKDEIRRMEAMAEIARTGNWFSQEAFASQSLHSSAYCDVRNIPSNWLCLSSLEQISIASDDLGRIDAEGLRSLNNYVLSGGFLAVNKVRSPQEVENYLPIDLSRKFGEAKREKSHNGTQANKLQLSDFQSPSLDLFENTIWDNYLLTTGRDFLNGGYTPTKAVYITPIAFSDAYEATDWMFKKVTEVGTSYLDSLLASPVAFASVVYDSATFVDGQQGTFMVAHGFGKVSLESRRRADNANILAEKNVTNRSSSIASMPFTNAFGSGNRTVRYSTGVGDDFWNWLIPSVGRTPVITFLTFVVLFVGGAVPGIMFWSNLHKRRIWLVVLIPATAMICTFFLFSYGLLKDGLGAVSRMRSLAFIDKNGDGMVWSRQAYFAATVSNDGFSLDKETQLNPILTGSFATLPTNEFFVSDGKQQYRGFLPPRLQTQFSIAHPLRKLSMFKRGPEQDSVIKSEVVRNDSNFGWDQAVFVGEDDTFYTASDVAPGGKAEFTIASRADAISELQKSYKSQPLFPPSDSPSVDQNSLGKTFSDFFGYRYSTGSNVFNAVTEEGVWQSHLGKATADQTVLPPGTYVIFANQAPYVERCLPDVRDQEGLHTIVGRW